MIDKSNNQSGLTLVETLVAISIFLLVTTATTGVLYSSLRAQRFAVEQTTATYLAIEGIEVVRKYRDSKRLEGLTGENLFPDECMEANGCTYDIVTSTFTNDADFIESSPGGTPLLYDELDRVYSSKSTGGRIPSPYSHQITVRQEGSSDTFLVTATVWFKVPDAVNAKVELSEIMYALPDFN